MVSFAALTSSWVVTDAARRQLFAFVCVLGAYYFERREIIVEVALQVGHHSTVTSGFKNQSDLC